jgi:sugar O-acyltransferase (sialic acid O-acetyltransferase NeuD family)
MSKNDKPLVIFGSGDIAELASFYFTHDCRCDVVAFTVDSAFRKQETFAGKPMVDFERISELYPPERYDLFIALAYTRMNQLRRDKCGEARAKGYRLPSYVSPRATTYPDFECGDNCFILEDNTVQPFARIGNNVTLWSGNHIGHHSVIEDDVFIASHVVVSGGVIIGRGSFLGVNATLRDHIRIGIENVVGAGVTILENTRDYAVFKATATEPAPITSQRLRKI